MQLRRADIDSIQANAVLIWKKNGRTDIVVIPKGPFSLVPEGPYFVGRKCFVWIVPSDGAWFETETRFLFDYDPAVIKPPSRIGLYLALLKKYQNSTGNRTNLFNGCVSAYSKLGKLENQIAKAATNRDWLFVIQGRIEKAYVESSVKSECSS